MGKTMCKARIEKREAEFYFRTVNENQLDADSAKEKAQLVISLSQCINFCSYSVSLITYSFTNKSVGTPGGYTEAQVANVNKVQFNKFFVMEYYFEKEQPLGFEVSINGSKTIVKTTLGGVMGSRGQLFNSTLPSGETLSVQGKSLHTSNFVATFDITVSGNLGKKDLCFFVKNLGTQQLPSNNLIYRSEIQTGIDNVTFDQISIPAQFLCNGDFAGNMIAIEIHDLFAVEKLGEKIGVLNQLITKPMVIPLKSSGVPRSATMKCKLVKNYSFLDFLRGGMQIALTIGIDFTKSNKDPFQADSLHNITSGKMNAYESAIKSCGDIVGYYDYDQLFPVFGYGAIIPGQNAVNHCFNLTMREDPNINTIAGVLKCYREVLPSLRFHGPTCFAPIVNELNRTVKEELAKNNKMTYNILMILTDGQINDLDDTVDALVEASFLPISVIIIGIGIADFGNMDILDADDNPLYDRNKRKAARDLVQFVPFFKYQNDGQKLSEEVLEEVPRQVIEYYQQNNIIPSDPIIPLAGEG